MSSSVRLDPFALTNITTPVHMSVRRLNESVVRDGFTLYVSGLTKEARKTDFGAWLMNKGFECCIIYWFYQPGKNPQDHPGWCFLQFDSISSVIRAKEGLQNAVIKDIPILIGSGLQHWPPNLPPVSESSPEVYGHEEPAPERPRWRRWS
ncbi:hypothetical protein B0J13DRAFT_530797 [Dactylonectria estremocensis]|uniref:RRM domain-containing protein n=1 Tax=Dactylonectria estremocensis TaxID=1079267 RepID=A0A9P9DWB2_9HYPO|nr:hypothetical protein B0J13DRAFT_530797 [Dactylonectria estremocensis]